MSRFVIVDTEEATLEGEMFEGSIFLHVTYKETSTFSASSYKKFLRIWNRVIKSLKDRGVEFVYSCIPHDQKIIKWQEMFGMSLHQSFEDCLIYRRTL